MEILPRIEDLLSPDDAGVHYLPTLVEMIKSEMCWSWRRYHANLGMDNSSPTVQGGSKVNSTWIASHILNAHRELLLELVKEEYDIRVSCGDKPDPSEYTSAFRAWFMQARKSLRANRPSPL